MTSGITFQMKIRGPLHMGTGMSRIGDLDRLARRALDNNAGIEGEQLKGAVRAAAEHLLRWLGGDAQDSSESYPEHPVIERLFAPTPDRFVRFEAPVAAVTSKFHALASTAIDSATGAAKHGQLRTIEVTERGAAFGCRIALYGDWTKEQQKLDALFLCAAVLCMNGIGSRKGTGFGAIEICDLKCDAIEEAAMLAEVKTVGRLQAHVGEKGKVQA